MHTAEIVNVSVIMPCLNAASTVATQLNALAQQSWRGAWDLIVADNGSSDGTLDIVKSFEARLPKLKIIDASQQRGSGFARNQAVMATRSEDLLFVDADDEVGHGWMTAMTAALKQSEFVAGRNEFAKLNEPHQAWMRNSTVSTGLSRLNFPPYLPHAGGGVMGLKRWVHSNVGGFDESLPRVMDTDFCVRVQRGGVPLQYVPGAVVHYRLRKSHAAVFNQSRLWAKYGTLVYLRYGQEAVKLRGNWRRHFLGWKRLLRDFSAVRRRETRYRWMFRAGWQLGRLQGALLYRVGPV